MNWYGLCHVGAEKACQKELARLDIVATPLTGAVEFTASKEDVASMLYHSQTLTRLLIAGEYGEWKEFNGKNLLEYIPEDATFKVECEVTANSQEKIHSTDIAAKIGEHIQRKVQLKKPDYTLYCQVASKSVLGIDITGDLSKRYYRIFTTRHAIKGTLAASLLYLHEKTGAIVDPFSGSGEIAIEAAMAASHVSPLRFQKHIQLPILSQVQKEAFVDDPHTPTFTTYSFDPELTNVRSAKKNAKLAAVEKFITFSKLDPEWMDVKFQEDEIEIIITVPPPVTHRNTATDHLKELAYQSEYILKKSGVLIVACLTPQTADAMRKHAKGHSLTEIAAHTIYTGKLGVEVLVYEL